MSIKVEPRRPIEELITSSVEQQILNGDQCIDVDLSIKMYNEAVAEMEERAKKFKANFEDGSKLHVGNPLLGSVDTIQMVDTGRPGLDVDAYTRLLRDAIEQGKKDGEEVPEDMKRWLENVEARAEGRIDLGNGWYVEAPRYDCGEDGFCRSGGIIIGYVFK